MRLYNTLSGIRIVGKSYGRKILLITFIGIHVPLIGMCLCYATAGRQLAWGTVLLLLLGFTLIATGGALYAINKLLSPLNVARLSLEDYWKTHKMPALPTHHRDEVGQLLKDIQDTLRRSDELLSEKSSMIDMLSHDLRSPVARISGLAQVIRIDEKEQAPAYADDIINECDSLLRMLQHILVMLRYQETDERSFIPQPTVVKELILSCMSSFDFNIVKKGIKWQIDIADNAVANIEPVLFSQVVKNLLSNAIKFSPAGTAIQVRCHIEGPWLLLSVKDNGTGFNDEDRDKLFQRFSSVGQPGLDGEPSTGLGLYLSKKIIERHGGTIMADSGGLDGGATFTIKVPYADYASN